MPSKGLNQDRCDVAVFIPPAQTFSRALVDVRQTQTDLLLSMLRGASETEYGKRYSFGAISSVAEFQSVLPLTCYEDYLPYIEQIRLGKEQVLTGSKVTRLHQSSGTSSPSKVLPFTEELKSQFRAGIGAWLHSIFQKRPQLREGSAYWILTPLLEQSIVAESGIEIGFDSDSSYFSESEQKALGSVLSVPAAVQDCKSINDCFFLTLLFLLADEELSWISIWNPSLLELLFRALEKDAEELVASLVSGTLPARISIPRSLCQSISDLLNACTQRGQRVRSLFVEHGWRISPTSIRELWPRLSFISAWGDGWAEQSLATLKSILPDIEIEPKGLLSTEGCISIPYAPTDGTILPAPLLAITSHFFEFLDLESREVLLPSDTEIGRRYEIVITTAGGLYRYRLGDIVQVEGFYQNTPCIKFISKGDLVVDLFGEKLHETHVDAALKEAMDQLGVAPEYYFLAPDIRAKRYVLCASSIDSKLAPIICERLDRLLSSNFNYAYCRKVRQLQRPALFLLAHHAKEDYFKSTALRSRAGVHKETALKRAPLHEWLPGHIVYEDTPLSEHAHE